MKVLLKTPLSPYSGYGRDGIEMVTAMIRRGWDVYLMPMTVQAPLPQHIADLLTKPHQAPFDLYINHTDPMALDSPEETTQYAAVNVAWTMWEFTGFKGVMPGKDIRTLRKRLKNFDILVGYSEVDREVFKPYFKGPIIVQQGGFDPEQWPKMSRNWNEKIRFIQHGVLNQRKDPWRLINAFNQVSAEHPEFMEGATLSLHTTAPGLHSKITERWQNVQVFYDIWPTDLVRDFYQSAHVLVSPSRGEGKDLPALEFMSTGGTVIATDWAGHQQWLDPSFCYPLRVTLEPAVEGKTDAMNARADIEHLKELLWHCFQNRREVMNKADLASRVVPLAHSWEHVLDGLIRRLKEALPEEQGTRLWVLDSASFPHELKV